MTKDKGKHRDIRQKIIEGIKDQRGVDGLYRSHDGQGDIKFFREINGRRINLAEPDIVVKKNGEFLVIEIELNNSPKHLMGVAFAINSSEYGEYERRFDIKKKSLLLVLDSKRVCKKGSRKPKQMGEIKSLIRNQLAFGYFDIITEKIASDVILDWINGKKEDREI